MQNIEEKFKYFEKKLKEAEILINEQKKRIDILENLSRCSQCNGIHP